MAQLAAPARRFLETETGSAGVLLAAAIAGLVWANSPGSDAYESLWGTEVAIQVGGAELGMDLGHWVNDGLLAVFFLVVGLEVREQRPMLAGWSGTGGNVLQRQRETRLLIFDRFVHDHPHVGR